MAIVFHVLRVRHTTIPLRTQFAIHHALACEEMSCPTGPSQTLSAGSQPSLNWSSEQSRIVNMNFDLNDPRVTKVHGEILSLPNFRIPYWPHNAYRHSAVISGHGLCRLRENLNASWIVQKESPPELCHDVFQQEYPSTMDWFLVAQCWGQNCTFLCLPILEDKRGRSSQRKVFSRSESSRNGEGFGWMGWWLWSCSEELRTGRSQ